MSAITSRPRIASVTLTTAAAGAVVAGAMLARALMRGASTLHLSTALDTDGAAERSAAPSIINAAAPRQSASVPHTLTTADAVRAAVAHQVSEFFVRETSVVTASLTTLQQATSVRDALVARDALMTAVRSEHEAIVSDSLAAACTRAASSIGFTAIDERIASDGTRRLVATNKAGHALVSEIRSCAEDGPSLATEVVGLYDGSCNSVLDAFDSALDNEGVRSLPPRRDFTGGVCQLSAARDVLRSFTRGLQSPESVATPTPTRDQKVDGARLRRAVKRQNNSQGH